MAFECKMVLLCHPSFTFLFRSFVRQMNMSTWDSCEIFIFLLPVCSNYCQISTPKLLKRSIVRSPAEKLLSSFSSLALCRRLWEGLAEVFPLEESPAQGGFKLIESIEFFKNKVQPETLIFQKLVDLTLRWDYFLSIILETLFAV